VALCAYIAGDITAIFVGRVQYSIAPPLITSGSKTLNLYLMVRLIYDLIDI
jgi:hypothetical protein